MKNKLKKNIPVSIIGFLNKNNNNMFNVYILYDQNKIPFYVGCGTDLRIQKQLKGLGNRPQVNKKVKKEKVTYEIRKSFSNKKEAFNYEEILIKEIGRADLNQGTLLNRTNGGQAPKGLIYSEKQKKAMSNRAKKLKQDSEYIKKHKEGLLKIINTDEYRKNQSDAAKKKWQNPEYKNKLIKAHIGRKDSEETKKRKSQQLKKSWLNNKRQLNGYSDEFIKEIYLLKNSMSAKQVADKYNLSQPYISGIWRHVKAKMALRRLNILKDVEEF